MTFRDNGAPEVLVVGAGPTGLVLALWLNRLGVSVRIVDQHTEPGTTSRALVIHARTLELYRQMGLAREVVQAGLPFTAVNLWVRGELVGRAPLGDIGRGLSPFPFMVIYPQDQHEQLLIEHLRRAGVEVERGTTLLDFDDRGRGVVARLQAQDGRRIECEVLYVAGCDGAHSRVRQILDIDFPGGTYERVFYVADVELHGKVANHELHVALDEADLVAFFPLKGENVARLIGTVRPESEARLEGFGWNDVSKATLDRMQVTVDRINWFSTYKVHHRVAHHFRRGSAFLVGDAAHVHSPVGGQGMNTGIGDAVNLAWKLADVIRRRADEKLLNSYELERAAFAHRLVATTDRAFTFVTRDGFVARRVRLEVVPRLVPALLERTAFRRWMFRTVSQTMLNYRHSSLSEGKIDSISGGDRLPWVATENGTESDNFTPLDAMDWQVHVYGFAPRELAKTCAVLGLSLHTFDWGHRAREAGFAEGASYLVRPDGYIALVDPAARPENLTRYLDEHGIRIQASLTAEPASTLYDHHSRWH